MIEIKCGEKSLYVKTGVINLKSRAPGCINVGHNDLYDWGFTHEEIHEAGKIQLQIGDVTLTCKLWPEPS